MRAQRKNVRIISRQLRTGDASIPSWGQCRRRRGGCRRPNDRRRPRAIHRSPSDRPAGHGRLRPFPFSRVHPGWRHPVDVVETAGADTPVSTRSPGWAMQGSGMLWISRAGGRSDRGAGQHAAGAGRTRTLSVRTDLQGLSHHRRNVAQADIPAEIAKCWQWPRFPRRSLPEWVDVSRSAARGSLYRHHFGEPTLVLPIQPRSERVLRRPALRVLAFLPQRLRCYDPADGADAPSSNHRAPLPVLALTIFAGFAAGSWFGFGKILASLLASRETDQRRQAGNSS